MKDIVLFILAIAVLGLGYLFIKGETQATVANPFAPETAVYSIDTSQPATVKLSDPVTVVTPTPEPAIVLEPVATATAYPASTSVPAPTRPAIETLPDGEGPYTAQQMQVCRDVWAQSLQAELTVHQFGYCQGVVER